eukprot:TRINITY_DN49503_c0_g1_i1.p1 TRINITY_DN49503_c0_g1~~TRINITY_DN49503_c0_g1_i1.p1  ORF type:complete len:495 (+),score=74.57 TRINITY_DN49503_c0_g1_i1:79-1485(+)
MGTACVTVAVAHYAVLFTLWPALAAAKFVEGRVALGPGESRVVGKFCYDFNPGCSNFHCKFGEHPGHLWFKLHDGRRVHPGSKENDAEDASFDAEGAPMPELFVALLDDEYFSYPEVSQVWGETNCSDITRAAKRSFPVEWSQFKTKDGFSESSVVVQKLRPRWWFFSLTSCSKYEVHVSYRMHMENPLQGREKEFSMDAVGVCRTTAVLCTLFGAAAAAQFASMVEWRAISGRRRWSQMHPALKLVGASAFSSALGQVCWLWHYWQFQDSGENGILSAVAARSLVVGGRTCMSLLLLLMAYGQCVCTPDISWDEHSELVAGMVVFGVLSLSLELWSESEFQTTTTAYAYDTTPGVVLVAFDIFFLWLFISRSWNTFTRETRPKARTFYRRYGPLFGLWFACLPWLALLASILAAHVRSRIVLAVGGAVHALALVALVRSFCPSVAFELYDLTEQECKAVRLDDINNL